MNSGSATTTLGKIQTKKPALNGKAKRKAKAEVVVLAGQKVNKLYLKIAIIVTVLALLGIGSWQVAKAQTGKILPRVTIAGLKVGGKTPAEAKKTVQSHVDELNTQGPEIVYSDEAIKPKLAEMGITFNVDKVVKDAYNFGRTGSLKGKILENSKMIFKPHEITLSQQVDEKKLDEFLSGIAQVVEVAPVDASLAVNNGNVNLSPSKLGRGLDKKKLKNDLDSLIHSGKTTGKITLVTSDLEPNIKEEEDTTEAQTQAQKYMQAAPIVLNFENQTFDASKGEVGSWITFEESGSKLVAELSNSKIGGFVSGIASQIEIPKVDKEIMEGTGEVLNEGQDGRGVDTGRLALEIRQRVLAATAGGSIAIGVYPIPKGEVTKNPHAQPGRYSGRYIDINLSEQTLYAFEGNKLVNQFLISSGVASHPSPIGEFSVYSKVSSQLMDGPDYYLPDVPWISWFSGDYSIHGTYWHSNFGTPMSHGCINASIPDAEWIYNWDEVGTPVYIHE